jgi:thymidine kinase
MGSLEIIMGPMFSGKTESLLSKYKDVMNKFWDWCIHENMNPESIFNSGNLLSHNLLSHNGFHFYNNNQPYISLAINYHKDTRYGYNIISSHNGNSIPSYNLENLSELFTDINNKKLLDKCIYIFINEAQFFTDLKECVIQLIEKYNKHVVICGLDSDFKRQQFGQIWDLIPHADKVTKLYGKCHNCPNKSLYTYRLSSESEQELIGNDNYVPLCRSCWCTKQNNIAEIQENKIA